MNKKKRKFIQREKRRSSRKEGRKNVMRKKEENVVAREEGRSYWERGRKKVILRNKGWWEGKKECYRERRKRMSLCKRKKI